MDKFKTLMYKCHLLTDSFAFNGAYFGAGNGTIHLHLVGCTGEETNLTDCPETRSSGYCLQGHSEDAGVRCQGLEKITFVFMTPN